MQSQHECGVYIIDSHCPQWGGHPFRMVVRNPDSFDVSVLVCLEHGCQGENPVVIHGRQISTPRGDVIPALPLKDQHP